MTMPPPSDDPSNSGAWRADGPPLPPGLQIDPIRRGLASPRRGPAIVLTGVCYALLLAGGTYLADRAWKSALRPKEDQVQTVRLILDEGSDSQDPARMGGRSASELDPPAQPNPASTQTALAAAAVAVRMESFAEPPEPLHQLEPPKELPKLLPEAFQPTGRASGIGSGLAGEIGNGAAHGYGRGRGATWIHTAQGGEEIRVRAEILDYKDYIHPEYPEAARSRSVSGDVVLEVTIDENGVPMRWTVLEGHPLLVESTLKVFPRWHFVPFRHQGKRVRATFEVVIRFNLVH